MPVRPRSWSEFDGEVVPAEDVDATPETAVGVIPAETVPVDEGDDHATSVFATDSDATIVPVLETADCPAKTAVVLILAENAPKALVAADPSMAMLSEGLMAPIDVVADTPVNPAVVP